MCNGELNQYRDYVPPDILGRRELQTHLHSYLTPHPELGKDTDERGCIPCLLIATMLYNKGWRLPDELAI